MREQFPGPVEADKVMKRRWQIINASGHPLHTSNLLEQEKLITEPNHSSGGP